MLEGTSGCRGPTPCSSRSTREGFLGPYQGGFWRSSRTETMPVIWAIIPVLSCCSFSFLHSFSHKWSRSTYPLLKETFCDHEHCCKSSLLMLSILSLPVVLCSVYLRFSRQPSNTALLDLHLLQSADFLYPCVLFLWDHWLNTSKKSHLVLIFKACC